MERRTDSAVEAAAAIAEAETGAATVSALRVCSTSAKKAPRRWTTQEEQFVRENLGKLSEAEIAKALGRTVAAVHLHSEREMHLPRPSRVGTLLTAEQVSIGLGLESKSVHRLMDNGLMPGRRLPLRAVIRVIDRVALLRWMLDPMHWVYFRPARVGLMHPRGKRGFGAAYDFAFWQEARRAMVIARRRWKDRWITPGTAANLLGINPALRSHPINRAIHRGTLPAVRWGNWWIRRSDLPPRGFRFNVEGRVVPMNSSRHDRRRPAAWLGFNRFELDIARRLWKEGIKIENANDERFQVLVELEKEKDRLRAFIEPTP